MPMPLLWVTIEIGPARSVSNSDNAVAQVAVTGDAALMMPMQLGPHSVKPTSRQTAASLFCNATPSPPTSANTMPLRVPRAAQARIVSTTVSAGIDRMTRSGVSGRSSIVGKHCTPCTLSALGLTAQILPGKPKRTTHRTVSPPRSPARSDAPITAIDFGYSRPETSMKAGIVPEW